MQKTKLISGLTWRQPVVFAVTTIICTLLAIYAVIVAPVGAAVGVSGLYLAAAVYVPVALWFGVWGCLAGYLSCIFMGIYLGMPLPFVLVWALADFFEGFIPLIIYRSLKTKPVLQLKRPKTTYTLNGILALVLVASAVALTLSYNSIFLVTFGASIILVMAQATVEDHRTGLAWLPIGVLLASIVSGLFGVGAMAAFGNIPLDAFPSVFMGWVFGDIIVLATLGTLLTVTLTPWIIKSKIYVKRFFA